MIDRKTDAEFIAEDRRKIAKLTDALKALQKEHFEQADNWDDAEQRGVAPQEGHSKYHIKWANFCKKVLEEAK